MALIQATNLITKKELLTTDPDTDAKQLLYEITAGPRNGYVENKLKPGTAVTTFTQGMELGCFSSSSCFCLGRGAAQGGRWEVRRQGTDLKGASETRSEPCCSTRRFSRLARAGDESQDSAEELEMLRVDVTARSGGSLASGTGSAPCGRFTLAGRGGEGGTAEIRAARANSYFLHFIKATLNFPYFGVGAMVDKV